jgi:diguanylate cyclase (GGDEF)-like protein/PAS domain S-box-containing protein
VSEFDNPEIYRRVLESLQIGVYIVDSNQRILFWNTGAEKITGYLSHEVVGAFCRDDLFSIDGIPRNVLSETASSLVSIIRNGQPSIADVCVLHKQGHRVCVRARGVPIRNDHGSIIGAAETFDENLYASEWDRRQNNLAAFGCIDQVTGVLNSEYTLSQLREKIDTFPIHHVPFSLVWVEIDGINRLRSNFGQGIIPNLLRATGRTIEATVRPSDLVGRAEDHRFLILLLECGASGMQEAAERLLKMIASSEVEWWGQNRSVTASLGGSTVVQGDTVQSILSRAEQALNKSANLGGNCFTAF